MPLKLCSNAEDGLKTEFGVSFVHSKTVMMIRFYAFWVTIPNSV